MKNFFSTFVSDPVSSGARSVVLGDTDSLRDGPTPLEGRLRRARLGLLVGLVGILMIFISFTSAYVVRQGLPTLDPGTNTLVRDWFPVRLPALLFINTLVLLVSTGTMEFARRQMMREAVQTLSGSSRGVRNEGKEKLPWLGLTVLLGISFLIGQWTAWQRLAANGFYVSTNPSSSFVYLLTGTHGVHLLGGILALLVAGAA